jgi:hypothetical protein
MAKAFINMEIELFDVLLDVIDEDLNDYILMDLLDLAQIPCIKCQNTTNQLADQEEHSLAICDRCL